MHPHAALIDALGGATALAREIGQPANVTGNWRKRGVSWRWRPAVAKIAEEKGVALPDGFLGPVAAAPAEAAE